MTKCSSLVLQRRKFNSLQRFCRAGHKRGRPIFRASQPREFFHSKAYSEASFLFPITRFRKSWLLFYKKYASQRSPERIIFKKDIFCHKNKKKLAFLKKRLAKFMLLQRFYRVSLFYYTKNFYKMQIYREKYLIIYLLFN